MLRGHRARGRPAMRTPQSDLIVIFVVAGVVAVAPRRGLVGRVARYSLMNTEVHKLYGQLHERT
jgi:hypothetical protein